MDTNNSQDDYDKLDISTIQYIIFRPFDEFYYVYSINSLDSEHLIEKNDIYNMMRHFNKETLSQIMFLTRRFFPFIYVVETKELLELEESLDESEISKYIREKQTIVENEVEPLTTASLFKKVSAGFKTIFG